MIPYASFLYFGVLLYVIFPTIIWRLTGSCPRWWILVSTLLMLLVQYGNFSTTAFPFYLREIYIVLGFAFFQWLVASGFLWIRARTSSRWFFYPVLLVSLAPLLAAKLFPLIGLSGAAFLGLSYVTFRCLDIIFSIHDNLIKHLRTNLFFAYLLFFPTISAGPIDRYRRFSTDWECGGRRDRASLVADLDIAIHRFFTGFLYKFILAYLIKRHWLDVAAQRRDFLNVLSYMYAYSFYLFFDFAGYSSFAIGLSYMFGVHPPENFRYPFLSRNVRDFWNRWHISLSFWFRDHVYMRFVLAATKGRWFKSKYAASYVGLCLSFGLMGLWHGVKPNFIIYGLYHALLLICYDLFSRWNKQYRLWGDGGVWQVAEIFITFHLICIGFLLFSGHLNVALRHLPLGHHIKLPAICCPA